jgi:hypothetical protein
VPNAAFAKRWLKNKKKLLRIKVVELPTKKFAKSANQSEEESLVTHLLMSVQLCSRVPVPILLI